MRCAQTPPETFQDVQGLEHSLSLALTTAARIVNRRAEQCLRKHMQCSLREAWAIMVICHASSSQRQIGRLLHLHPNVVVKLIDGLEKKKYARRIRNSDDRREYVLVPTVKAQEFMAAWEKHNPKIINECCQPLTPTQSRTLRSLVMQITKQP